MRAGRVRPYRVPFALTAVAGAIAVAALIAGAGSAQGPPTTLHLVGTSQTNIGFAPGHQPDRATGSEVGRRSPGTTRASSAPCAR